MLLSASRSRALSLPTTSLSQETILLVASLWFSVACNGAFWRNALGGKAWAAPGDLMFGLGLVVLISSLHFVLLALVSTRFTLKPVLAVLILCAGVAAFFMDRFGVFINPEMLRNVLRTDTAEAGELLTWNLLAHLLFYAGVPLLLLYRVQVRRLPFQAALGRRLLGLAAAIVCGVGSMAANYQELASLMRNDKELRYLINPGNVVYSLTRALVHDGSPQAKDKQVIAPDARLAASWQHRTKPALFVLVVGETARAANWGLHQGPDGLQRQTTPELAARDLIRFADTSSCGTDTETSVPCMFSVQGRRHYDEQAIRSSESLLHVLDRAGFRVLWRDNQSGCKGVCTGLELQRFDKATDPRYCKDGERCLDEILLDGLDQLVADNQGNLVLVLHQLGNHGPSYYKRYPPQFRRFLPTCDSDDLSQCSAEQVMNSYDNALLYTDHFLARTLDFLERQQDRYDTGLIYVSDHGESLGENGLFLHGLPYSIAPRTQTRVPMFAWISKGLADSTRIDLACLRNESGQSVSHDNLFHSILGLLDVETRDRDPSLDLTAPCKG